MPRLPRHRRWLVAGVAAAVVVTAVQAHDTWFSRLEGADAAGVPAGALALALSTGSHYPVREFNPGAVNLAQAACRTASDQRFALQPLREAEHHLALTARPPADAVGATTCWAELKPFTVDLTPELVQVYFREIRPGVAVQAAWADMQARGVRWHERYVKHARAEWAGASGAVPEKPAVPQPTGMALDLLLDTGTQPVPVGQPLGFQVLRDGQPLADLAVELVSDRLRFGQWTRTDAQGRARVTVPFAGGWVLRGTDLRLSSEKPDSWDSHFITLAFEARR